MIEFAKLFDTTGTYPALTNFVICVGMLFVFLGVFLLTFGAVYFGAAWISTLNLVVLYVMTYLISDHQHSLIIGLFTTLVSLVSLDVVIFLFYD